MPWLCWRVAAAPWARCRALALAPLHALAAAGWDLGGDRASMGGVRAPMALAPWPCCWRRRRGGLPRVLARHGFRLLGPLMSALVGAGMGRLAALLARARIWSAADSAGPAGRLVLPGALAFLQGPQVFGYAPAVGWVAGACVKTAWPYTGAMWPTASSTWPFRCSAVGPLCARSNADNCPSSSPPVAWFSTAHPGLAAAL